MNVLSRSKILISILLRVAAAVSFNLIEFTIASDIAGGKIGELVWIFVSSGNVVLSFIGAVYCIAFLVWIVTPAFVKTTSVRSIRNFSLILSVPLIINLALQIVDRAVDSRFLIGCAIFYVVLFFNFRVMRRGGNRPTDSKEA